jgi:uncharacterized protein YegJ (DUF2314 family)
MPMEDDEPLGQPKFARPPDEPSFLAISQNDPAFHSAYDDAAATIPQFIELIQAGGKAICSAKLRFRDPDLSDRLGENRYVFLWVTSVFYHVEENVFSGVFYEVPSELQKWHRIGQGLSFEAGDIFDWMVNCEGRLFGGYTLRVTRAKLPEEKREDFDRYVGVYAYEPLPG